MELISPASECIFGDKVTDPDLDFYTQLSNFNTTLSIIIVDRHHQVMGARHLVEGFGEPEAFTPEPI